MEQREYQEDSISGQNKAALQSETRQKVRKIPKTEIVHFTESPEIQHFAMVKENKNDNVYGATWGNLVREYLNTEYAKEDTQTKVVVSDGITYKVMNRGEVTSFYNSDGHILFDVENRRLEKEYKWLMKDSGEAVKETMEPYAIKKAAKKKLEKERKADPDKAFAEPILAYLLKRCEEDLGLAQDVLQGHKTWKKCFAYIHCQARKQAKGGCAAVRDDVVYEWAEDYYHTDDKAEEEKKAKKEAEDKAKRKKAAEEKKAAGGTKGGVSKTGKQEIPKQDHILKKQPKPKRNGGNLEGQLDMFSMMGI